MRYLSIEIAVIVRIETTNMDVFIVRANSHTICPGRPKLNILEEQKNHRLR